MLQLQVNFEFPTDILAIIFTLLAWVVVAYFIFRIYQEHHEKPKLWKIVTVIIVGLFSFSFNVTIFDTLIKIAILPLGVWIVYWILKDRGNSWERYRKFAWLGFWANYLFIVTTLLTIPLHNSVYPKNELATYLSRFENGAILQIHPSAREVTMNNQKLKEQLQTMVNEPIQSDFWYQDLILNVEPDDREERFPYQFVGTSSKWGSGLATLVLIENDGKGLLITTAKRQVYFRSDESFLEGEIFQ